MADIHPEEAAARRAEIAALEHNFPGVQVWFGPYTRHWWAIYDGRLFEGRTLGHIGEQIFRARQCIHGHANSHVADPVPPTGDWRCCQEGRPAQCRCRLGCGCQCPACVCRWGGVRP